MNKKEDVKYNNGEHKYCVQYNIDDSIFWGIGIENETYIKFNNTKWFTGKYINTRLGRERYSVNYLHNYDLNKMVN